MQLKNLAPLNRNILLAAIIIVMAAALRFFHYTGFSLSNDELSALVRVQFGSFSELVRKGFYVDGHPGGIQIFLFYWVKVFGDSESSIRFPFVVMGVMAVWFSWLSARRWFGETSALFIASGIAFLQFPILYSQIARPYGAGLFFSMLTIYFWTRLVLEAETGNKRKYFDAIGYTAANALMMYNHYFSFLVALIIGITGLFLLKRENRKHYLLAGILSALIFLPHIQITLNHLKIGGVGLWLGKPDYNWLPEHLAYVFNNSYWVVITVILISLVGFIGTKSNRRIYLLRVMLLLWFLMPIAIGFFYSRWVNPVLQHSVVIFSFPFLLFFLFSFPAWKTDTFRAILLGILGVVMLASTLIERKYYKTQHFGEFRDVAARIADADRENGAENITRAISVNNPFYIEYYLKPLGANPKFMQYDNRGGEDLSELKNILETSTTPMFMYAWTKSVPYETDALILHYYPFKLKHVDYNGLSAFTLYTRDSTQEIIKPKHVFEVMNGFETSDYWQVSENLVDSVSPFNGKKCILLKSENEYGPTFQMAAGDIPLKKGNMINVKLLLKTVAENTRAVLVVSLEQWEQTPYLWAASPVSNFAEQNRWSAVFLSTPVKELKSPRDILKVYLWNPGHEEIAIDDMRISVD